MTTTETVKLAPCPFCGGEARIHEFADVPDCGGCHALGPVADTVPEAIAAWNRRAGGEVEPGRFQDRVAAAHVALFHDDPTDVAERRDRFYEEATETVQTLGMTEDDAHKLVSYTFSRPPGDVRKEIGAAALTLASLCVIGGWDMMECAEADLAALRTPEKIAKVRAKRATRHGRGPLPGHDPAALASPNPAPSGETVPVAWRWTTWPYADIDGEEWAWTLTEQKSTIPSYATVQPLYAAPPPPQVEITEAMVEAAWRALDGLAVVTHDDVRAALTAALSPNGRAAG